MSQKTSLHAERKNTSINPEFYVMKYLLKMKENKDSFKQTETENALSTDLRYKKY